MFKNIKKQIGSVDVGLAGGLTLLVLFIAALYGYVENIVKLAHIEHVDGHIFEIFIRIVGVFTGLVGAIAGYF